MSYWKVAAVLLLGLCCGVAVIFLMGKASNLLAAIAKPKTLYIVVLDAETDKAIPDADVSLNVLNNSVLNTAASNPPLRIKTLYTGATAGVSLAPGTSFTVNLDAKGYENSSGQYKKTQTDNEFLKFRLKKLKKITLTVPNGYVGTVIYAPAIPPTINNRGPTKTEYQLRVNEKGEIEDVDSIQTSPDFYIFPKSMVDGVVLVRYENGQEIPWAGDKGVADETIALRPIKDIIPPTPYPSTGFFDNTLPHISFVIGTAQDLKEATDKKPKAEEQEVKVQLDAASPTP
jgi:hypothetical protein